jgi:hypothetical protein
MITATSVCSVRSALAAIVLCVSLELSGCANGDFDRVRPFLVVDEIHDWLGTTAAIGNGAIPSPYPLTDDERLLRDLAYPLIEPPYDLQRWYSVLNQYGIGRLFQHDWSRFDLHAYGRALLTDPVRSQSARYARLNDDVRNDRTRAPPFFAVASRVLDMDRRRHAALSLVEHLNALEDMHARERIAENELVVSWVQWSLKARCISYRLALERLAVAAPMTAASEVERSLTALDKEIAEYRLLPEPDVAPGPGFPKLPDFEGPVLHAKG